MSTLEVLGYVDLPGERSSVPSARAWARQLLDGRVPAAVLDDVLLLLSEVTTNAVIHSDSGIKAGGLVTVCVACSPDVIHVEVIDEGSVTSKPTVHESGPDCDGGRGLFLVNLMATAWGIHHDDESGNTVWFHVRKDQAGEHAAALSQSSSGDEQ